MAFVNEYESKKDIDTYGLFELRCKYSLALQRKTKEYFTEGKNIWTIDRDREIWLEPGISITDPETDYRMPLGYEIFTLYIHGKYYEVILTIITDESGIISDGVRAVPWKLVSLRPTPKGECSDTEQMKVVEEALKTESAKHFSDQSIIEALKEALEVYGINGQTGPHGIGDTHIKVDNIIVTLKV